MPVTQPSRCNPPRSNPQPYHFMSAKFTMSWRLPFGGINTSSPHSLFSPHTYLVAESFAHRWCILVVSHLHRTSKVGTTPAVFGHLGCLIFDLLLRFTYLFLSSSPWPQSEEMKTMLQETKTHPSSSFLFSLLRLVGHCIT